MNTTKHKVFISYHKENDEQYRNQLLELNRQHGIFTDSSNSTENVDAGLPDEEIRTIIRDEYLCDSTVTILLAGTETKTMENIDWELYSSMYGGGNNTQSGVLVINLPTTNCKYYTATHSKEKELLYPENKTWIAIDDRAEYEKRYPHMPDRIIDNLLIAKAKISVVCWEKIINDVELLRYLIEETNKDKAVCEYDLNREMQRKGS